MLSHRGRVRQGNEDACGAAPEVGAYVVCDGMGGAAAGEIASSVAVDVFLGNLKRGDLEAEPRARLQAAVEAANEAVYRQSVRSPELSGMGTTLVALLHAPLVTRLRGDQASRRSVRNHPNARAGDPPTLWLGHVGDSRCYRWRRGVLEQRTNDHSLVEEQVRAGQITAEEAAHSPMRNLITRAIGAQATVEVEIQGERPLEGDVYLLASDGLTHEVSDAGIAEILGGMDLPLTARELTAGCERLITAANRSGGHDNITVLLVGVMAG